MKKPLRDKPVPSEPGESRTPSADRISKNHHLPKREIIKKSDDFKMIIQSGHKWAGRHVMVFYLPSDQRRIGFAVSRRMGNAVFRNKLKRWMREAYRTRKHEIGSFQMIMMPKHRFIRNGLSGIARDVDRFIHEKGKACIG